MKGNQCSHHVGATVETSKKIFVFESAKTRSFCERMIILNLNGGIHIHKGIRRGGFGGSTPPLVCRLKCTIKKVSRF